MTTSLTTTITLTLSWLLGPVEVPTRVLTGDFFHQTAPTFTIDSCADPARVDARYQNAGGPGVWYGSSLERGAWAEQLRHFGDIGVSPLEIKRRVGRLGVALTVLDLTDAQVQAALQVTDADLTGDDYTRCQEIAHAVFTAGGAGGLLSPSAALPGCTTVAIFNRDLSSSVQVRTDRVQRMPVSVLDHVPVIRVIGPDADEVEDLLRRLAEQQRRKRRVQKGHRRARRYGKH